MNQKLIYTKNFHALHNLQEEYTLQYHLLERHDIPAKRFGIQVTEMNETKIESDQLENLFVSEEDTIEVLTLLYENAIDLDTWRDVVADALMKMRV